MANNMYKVEVFQPRSSMQFYDSSKDKVTNEEMFHDLRDLRGGFGKAEELTFEKFARCYNLVGGEVVRAESEGAVLEMVFDVWQNKPAGAGRPVSEVFVESNRQERATSMSTGDIIRVNGTAYLCESIGWAEVAELSY